MAAASGSQSTSVDEVHCAQLICSSCQHERSETGCRVRDSAHGKLDRGRVKGKKNHHEKNKTLLLHVKPVATLGHAWPR